MRYPNALQIQRLETAFSRPRTVAVASRMVGISIEQAQYAVRLLQYTCRITETVDSQGNDAFVRVSL